MRRALVALASLTAGCTGAPGIVETCDQPALDRPVIVLERGEQTSALARLSGGCLAEAPPDLQLGYDQNLLGARGKPFCGLNDTGVLRPIDTETLTLGAPLNVYPDDPSGATIHGIYGVDADASGDLWVSRSDKGSLVVLAPDGALRGFVDLSALDPDGVPDMNGIHVSGGKAYVALGFLPAGMDFGDHAKQAGAIAVVDVATRALQKDLIQLQGRNPVRALVPTSDAGDVVIVATPGIHDQADAADGVDRVWLDGSGKVEQLVSETEGQGSDAQHRIDGSIDEVVWGGEDEVYAVVLGAVPMFNPTRVVRIDPSQPAGARVVCELAHAPWYDDHANGAAYVHTGLALTRDYVLVGDRTPGAEKILAFRRKTCGDQPVSIPKQVQPPAALLALPP